MNGNPGPRLVVNPPQPVPADTISGKLSAAGHVHGNLYDFDLVGRAAGEKVVVRGNSIESFKTEYAMTHVRTPESKISVAIDADGVSAMGFAFDTVTARVTYASPGGHVDLAVTQGNNRRTAPTATTSCIPIARCSDWRTCASSSTPRTGHCRTRQRFSGADRAFA